MDKKLFDQLRQSMKEGVAIAKGDMQPSRVLTVHISEVENGKRTIGKKIAKTLAEAMNIDYRVFL